MSWGISIVNNAGAVMIDGNYSNYSLVSKGRSTCTTIRSYAGTTWTGYTTSLTFSGRKAPLLAVRGVVRSAWFSYLVDKTAVDTYVFKVTMASNGSQFDWWLFDGNAAQPAGSTGMLVKTESGQVAWHSDWQVLRPTVVGNIPNVYSDDYGVYGGEDLLLPIPNESSSLYALILASSRASTRNDNIDFIFTDRAYVDSGYFRVRMDLPSYWGGGPSYEEFWTYTGYGGIGIVADVTGY